MKKIALLLLLVVIGCSPNNQRIEIKVPVEESFKEEVKSKTEQAKNWITKKINPKAEEERLAKIETDRSEAEKAEKQAEELEIQKRNKTFDLIYKWADKLEKEKDPNGNGFIHYKGETELDGFGEPITVRYEQEGIYEYMIVSSSNVSARRETQNPLKFYKNLGFFGWLKFIVCSVVTIVIIVIVFNFFCFIRMKLTTLIETSWREI